jgi:hypothetical protein
MRIPIIEIKSYKPVLHSYYDSLRHKHLLILLLLTDNILNLLSMVCADLAPLTKILRQAAIWAVSVFNLFGRFILRIRQAI